MILEMSNIYKNYIQGNMDVPVLKDINFSVEEGEYVAIMGPSGSGKSTLMNIIGCLDQATSGTYILDGKAIENYSDKELARVRNEYIGFVFQTFNLLPKQSALDNVALPLQYAGVPRRYRRERCIEALSMVGLEDRVNFKPTQLSGGQKQRVAIARAMINNPKILLADEPTGALDSKSGVQVMELFSQLHQQGKTIIMITHSDEIASYADRVIKIIDGEIYDEDARNSEIAGNGLADTQSDREVTI
jgi:putative ABC transport system ATP-binding protein